VRCPRCGNENQTTNRFCGMCGATLLPPPAASEEALAQKVPAQAAAPPATSAPQAAPRTSAPISDESPVISGPSFLGLNEPAPSKRTRAGLSLDSGRSSRNLDYLLEDDEEPKRGGAGKWILMLVALALAVGFGYLRWKDQGFSWLNSGTKKPAAATTATDDSTAPSSNAPAATPAPVVNPPATATGSQPTTDSAAASSSPSAPNPSASSPPASTPTPAPNSSATSTATNATPSATSSSAPANTNAGSPNSANPTSAPAAKDASTKDSNDDASDSADTDKPQPAPAATKPAPVTAAKPTPVRPVRTLDPVTEAQKYIYGKGAAQDCDRGMRLLKPAADQSNTKAMVEMGALYSAGLCTPRDLPTAYRWFALALRKDPDNQSVQADLQKLWGEMTQPERQLAIRLSQ
jgi:hypothetical protein